MESMVLYSRVSTSTQEYANQFRDLEEWSILQKFNVVERFGEKVSGYSLDVERIEFDKMKNYIIKNGIKHIGVWDMSRFGRSMTRSLNDIEDFNKIGVSIHFKKEGLTTISNNVLNTLLMANLSAMAQMERDTFLERGKSGRMGAVLKGRMIGYSNIPYGYQRSEAGILEVNEDEAKIIRLMFDLAIKGVSLYGIAQELESLDVPTRNTLKGKKRTQHNGDEVKIRWKANVVGRNLKRTLYKGLRVYKGVDIKVPLIVSEEIWDKAQTRFAENLGYLNRKTSHCLFKGKMKCGIDNHSYVTYTTKTKLSYYLCTERNGRSNYKCQTGYLNSKMLDDNLYEILFQHKDSMLTVNNDIRKGYGIEEMNRQIENYKNDIIKLEAESKKVVKLYRSDFYSDDEHAKEQLKIRNKITELNNNISMIVTKLKSYNNIGLAETLSSYWYTDNFDLRREFVTKYVDKILIYKADKTNIEFKNPLHNNEKIVYIEMWAFGSISPLRIVLTPYSKNVVISNKLVFFNDFKYLILDKRYNLSYID